MNNHSIKEVMQFVKMIECCNGCTKRKIEIVDGKPITCHSYCKDYIKSVNELKEDKKRLDEYNLKYVKQYKKSVIQRIKEKRRI